MPRKTLYIKPNKASIAAARRGLKARDAAPKSKKGGLDALQAHEEGVGSGVLRARDIISGKKINAYQVKAFFDRHQGNYLKAKMKGLKPEESKAIQAWLIWGGDPLYRQVKSAVEKDRRVSNPSDLEIDYCAPEPVSHTRASPQDIDLVNARERAKKFKSFSVPTEAQIRKIEVGDHIKVGLGKERIWVKVTGYVGRKYHGICANGKLIGVPIFFQKKNIMDMMKE